MFESVEKKMNDGCLRTFTTHVDPRKNHQAPFVDWLNPNVRCFRLFFYSPNPQIWSSTSKKLLLKLPCLTMTDKSPNCLTTITYYDYGELYDIICFMVYRTTSWDKSHPLHDATTLHRAPSCPVKALGPHGELLHVRLIIAHVQRLVEAVGPHQIGDPNAEASGDELFGAVGLGLSSYPPEMFVFRCSIYPLVICYIAIW